MQNLFRASSRGFAKRENSFCQGVARKLSQHCPLKINQMIMAGIMSEGSEEDSGPRYARWPETRSARPSVSNRPLPPTESPLQLETVSGRAPPDCAGRAGSTH